MNNLNNTLIIAPNIEIPITFQDVKIELIIGWEPPETIKEESILVYPIPILVDYDGTFELIQPQSIWSADIANKSFNKLQALVINGHENIKEISLLKSIHTNRAHFNRKQIKDQLLNNKALKQRINEAYNIKNPTTEMNNLLGCDLYCSRQINRFSKSTESKSNNLTQKKVSVSTSDNRMLDDVNQSILEEEVSASPINDSIREEKPATPSFKKITIKDWNSFAEETNGVWKLHTIVEKSGGKVKHIIEFINQRLSENDGDLTKVWEIVSNKLGKKS
ncbi:MAG: hypothetical protein Q9N62_09325 [Ghiorsea sp.]|nr:hypothetical protein [Ghiorsea sp.]